MRTGLIAILCAAMFVTVAFASAASPLDGNADASGTSVKPGLYLNPAQEYVQIGLDDVKSVIASEIPRAKMETLSGGLINDRVYGKLWQFTFWTEAHENILMGVDAETGDVEFFFGRTGGNITGEEKISLEKAKQIASDYIKGRDDNLNLIPVMANYVGPHAEGSPGEYLIRYSRVIDGVRCLSDGITVTVNPVSGHIMSYYRSWTMPEDQIPTDAQPSVSESEAGAIVTDFMTENGAEGIQVLSSEMQWVDMNYPAGLQDPHDIHLAWRVRFIDDYYRSHGVTFPPAIWVDAETGEILKCLYSLG